MDPGRKLRGVAAIMMKKKAAAMRVRAQAGAPQTFQTTCRECDAAVVWIADGKVIIQEASSSLEIKVAFLEDREAYTSLEGKSPRPLQIEMHQQTT